MYFFTFIQYSLVHLILKFILLFEDYIIYL